MDRHLRFAASSLVILALAACGTEGDSSPLVGPETSLSEGATQQFIPVDGGTFTNPCTGERVGFDPGSVQHRVTRVADDGAGGFHVTVHINGQHYHGPGLDELGEPTGTQYQGAFVENYSFHAKPPFPATETWTRDIRVISSGPDANFVVKLRVKLTVDGDGDVTVDRGELQVVCPG